MVGLGAGQAVASRAVHSHVRAIHIAGAGLSESGYEIFIAGASDMVVERSVAGDNGWPRGNLGETGGIEAIAGHRVLLPFNEAYANHRGASDGGAIIPDVTTDSIMQFTTPTGLSYWTPNALNTASVGSA